MKKVLAGLLILSSSMFAVTNAVAGGIHHHHHHRHHAQHYHRAPQVHHWLVPAIIGGAVVYAATRSDPMPVQAAPVIVNPVIVTIDGVAYRREIMLVNGVAQEVLVRVQ